MKRYGWHFPLLAPCAGFLMLLFVAPLTWSLSVSLGLDHGWANFTLHHYRRIFTETGLYRGLWMSLYYGLVPVAIALVLAIGMAALLRRHFPGRDWFNGLYKIPLAIPGVIAALIVLVMAERGGFLDRLLGLAGWHIPRLVRDPWGLGVILTTVWKQLPFMTLIVSGALAAVPRDVIDGARTLGANRWRVLLLIELPLALPGISAAVLLGFIGALGSFAIPDLVGPPSPHPLSVRLYTEFGHGDMALVCAIGVVLSLAVMTVLLAYYRLTRWGERLLGGKRNGDE